ncbi:stage II sporulation protein M [Hahella sp. KA22]|uniref:stage II sporulation protein M n=1 Tax=Hahella sp. KA22 TaxID=1628392 RepID=UPI000FDEDD47|nr:stage II sporulation protein M [Hahella sp. KA22]AZZ89874.1 stage II sporulation protein M [Hahella sp. KA22]QAY53243.1 stage II sporulation protein M [Hahella sp. KA22]
MKQDVFERQQQHFWSEYAVLLQRLETGDTTGYRNFASSYRRLCQHLSVARHRSYSPHLISYLNDLMLRGHQMLYRRPSHFWLSFLGFIRYDFPQAVRANQQYVWLASALLYLPFIVLIIAIKLQPDLVNLVLDPHDVASYEAMYDPTSERLGRPREASTDVQMFGFYIYNNIGIAFRTFATGILYTLGSLFFLIYNGIHMGAVAGHLTEIGYTEPFWTFVIAHGAFELTAIVFSGAAGIKLGFSLLSPGNLSRLESLKRSAKACTPILFGMAGMLLIAAFIEAFWSSDHTMPATVKYSVGAVMWALVTCYFVFSGRVREPR